MCVGGIQTLGHKYLEALGSGDRDLGATDQAEKPSEHLEYRLASGSSKTL